MTTSATAIPPPATIRNVTIRDLPEEVLDLITDYCGAPENWLAIQTLSAWTLACRRFVPSGQRAMCRRPAAASLLPATKAKAFSFLQTIRAHPHLGAAVRDLSFLAGSVERFLRFPTNDFSSAIDRAIDPWAWQDTMLELCSQATRATVLLRDVPHAQSVGKLLVAGRRVQVLALQFAPDNARQEHAAVRALAKAMGGMAAPRMDHITFATSGHAHASKSSAGAVKRPHYNTRKLTIDVQKTCIQTVASYIPKQLHSLRSLEIVLGSRSSNKGSLDDVLKVLGNNYLTSFSLPSAGFPALDGPKEAYPDMIAGLALPLALFSTFKHLRKLDLRGCRGMDLARLAALADTSGATLTHLDLGSTFWDLKPEDLATEHAAGAPSAFEADLMRILDRMPRLRSFIAGLWPFADGGREGDDCRCALRAWADARGMRLILEGCFDVDEEEEDELDGLYDSDEGFYSDEYDDYGGWGERGRGYAYGFF
ncbi:hypothetical protein JCM10449v2_001539 [Rhodotorula kratochvilovae]